MTSPPSAVLVRGSLLHFLTDPGPDGERAAWEYFADGALFIEHGLVRRCGPWQNVLESLPAATRDLAQRYDYTGKLIVPGFVDSHTHYVQMQLMGSFGPQLLDWLERYTFPIEQSFADEALATRTAAFFLDRLLAHGTTTAAVFATMHPHSVDAFFRQAEQRRLRMLCGKVMMDRNCPENLRDTAESSLHDSRELIERWHGRGRLRYSISPRFAPTSSSVQLAVAGELFHAYAGLHVQTHLSESRREVAWVRELFPGRRDYLDVYAHYGLLGHGATFGHGIHLSADELQRLAQSGSAIAFCPSSNQFLGSGVFDHAAACAAGVTVGLASDVGAGTSLSMLRTMAAAYAAGQARQQPLSPWQAWYMASLGGAKALALDEFIGNFAPGREADFVVLDGQRIPELGFRLARAGTLMEQLFALMMLGDERCVAATHILGERAFGADA